MDPLQRAVDIYPYVFHPSTVIGLGMVLLIHYEWARQSAGTSVLWKRLGVFLGVGVLAFVPTVAYFALFTGGLSTALEGSTWQLDMLVATGLFLASGALWYLWNRYDWGPLVPEAAVILAAVTVPYAALSPFWDISGHVMHALMPTLYLTLVDRRYWPLLAIPILMIPNRIMVNAHTWAQTIAGFVIALVVTVGLFYLRTSDRTRAESLSTSQ